jgi:hypothetical protein
LAVSFGQPSRRRVGQQHDQTFRAVRPTRPITLIDRISRLVSGDGPDRHRGDERECRIRDDRGNDLRVPFRSDRVLTTSPSNGMRQPNTHIDHQYNRPHDRRDTRLRRQHAVCDRWVGALAIAASPVPNRPFLTHPCRGVSPAGRNSTPEAHTLVTHLVTRR